MPKIRFQMQRRDQRLNRLYAVVYATVRRIAAAEGTNETYVDRVAAPDVAGAEAQNIVQAILDER